MSAFKPIVRNLVWSKNVYKHAHELALQENLLFRKWKTNFVISGSTSWILKPPDHTEKDHLNQFINVHFCLTKYWRVEVTVIINYKKLCKLLQCKQFWHLYVGDRAIDVSPAVAANGEEARILYSISHRMIVECQCQCGAKEYLLINETGSKTWWLFIHHSGPGDARYSGVLLIHVQVLNYYLDSCP